ncbi:MAG: acyl-CoA thioesterase domain-containing protein [Actinomycetota bacterium]
MTAALDQLIAIVTLEPLGDDRFRGRGSTADGVDATFGGHFLAQAVAAAQATVGDEHRLHSLHGYFLRAGTPGQEFELQVERVRDGFSFCNRRVTVSQEPGRAQLELTGSFARPEGGPELAPTPPPGFADLPAPTSLPSYRQLMSSLDPLPLPRDWALRDYGLDLRTIDAPWAPGGSSYDGGIRLWVKADGPLPDDPALHQALMVYQSDESLADNVAIPWGATWGSTGVVFVSLDHAMWFHRPLDLNRWHLLDQRPISVAGGRGLAVASLWDDHGHLVATINQEALLRLGPEFLEDADG